MKHILFATTGIALALGVVVGMSKPATADVDILATIRKDKDIDIDQRITINKRIDIRVAVTFDVDGGAEAQALLNVTNNGQSVEGRNREDEARIRYAASLVGSANGNRGVWGVNQDAGNMANQGNVVSVAGISGNFDVFAQSQAHADQENRNNTVFELEELLDTQGQPLVITNDTDPGDFQVNKSASITGSINGNQGIINVNQNAGNMNNQSNGVAVAVGLGAEFAMSEGDLGQENTGNTVDELSTVKVDSISGSINGNTGVVNVNQSTGNMNNQGNVVSVAAIVSGAFINTQTPTAP
jgi:hypothetical protein